MGKFGTIRIRENPYYGGYKGMLDTSEILVTAHDLSQRSSKKKYECNSRKMNSPPGGKLESPSRFLCISLRSRGPLFLYWTRQVSLSRDGSQVARGQYGNTCRPYRSMPPPPYLRMSGRSGGKPRQERIGEGHLQTALPTFFGPHGCAGQARQ